MVEPLAARRLGVYYTPDRLAVAMTRWALADGATRVLDPSCGDGRFVRAAAAELADVHNAHVAGIDVDREAIRKLRGERLAGVHLEVRSFFVAPAGEHRGGPFAAVVGNPPYIRHHWQDPAVRREAQGRARDAGVTLSNLADLWAFFVVHAAQHVALDGRLALVLPIAATQSDYTAEVWSFLKRNFGRIEFVVLQDRAFKSTREQPVILLASHRGGSTERVHTSVSRTIDDLSARIAAKAPRARAADGMAPDGVADWKWNLLPVSTRRLWIELCATPSLQRLGNCADVRIGTVTGANSLFVRTDDDPLLGTAGVNARPVVSSSRLLSAAVWRRSDDRATGSLRGGGRLLIIDPRCSPSGLLRDAITNAENDGIHQRHHCSLRDPWWALRDLDAPHAFLGYMGASPHPLVRNASRALCTNSVHRVTWKGRESLRGAVVSSWSSLYRLSAELYGRHYGGGVLKLEPTAAKRLPIVPVASVGKALESLDATARSSGRAAASALADQLVADALGASLRDTRRLEKGAELLADARRARR